MIETAAAFAEHAEALSDWLLARVVHRKDVFGQYTADGKQFTAHDALSRETLILHCRGEVTIGLHTSSSDGMSKTAALDIDAHDDKADPGANWRCALRAVELFAAFGLEALVFDSDGKGGYHVACYLKKPVPSAVAHWLVEQVKARLKAEGFAAPEGFPKQPEPTLACPFGNWLRAPAGRHHKREHWCRVYDARRERWLEGEATVRRLLSVAGDDPSALLKAHRAEQDTGPPADDPWTMRVPGPSGNASRGGAKRQQAGASSPDEAELRSALDHLADDLAADYDSWLHVGMALHDWDSGRGLGLWKEFSGRCREKYDPAVCDAKWSTFSSCANGVTVRSIFKEAWDNGWVPPERPKAEATDGSRRGGDEPTDEDSIPIPPRAWPVPPEDVVFYGLAGEIVRALEPHTEADELGMLTQLLVMFGSVVGRGPHYSVEDTRHACNENVVLVGDSAVGRKGTATDRMMAMIRAADEAWARDRIRGGLSSGEGLISAVRDPVWGKVPVKEKGRIVDYQDVMLDGGVDDKRLCIIEPEFGGVLRVLDREGNKLSALLRQAWDSGCLASLTKNPLKATDAHISILGHITADELLAHLSRIDLVNGLANRFLWIAVRRSKILPFGGRPEGLSKLSDRVGEALTFARDVGRMEMSPSARDLWQASYRGLTTPPPGKLGAVTSRGAPHTVRLAMLYALMDRSGVITAEHLTAALALWQASARCAAFIFGDSLGHPDADKILKALRQAPEGLTRSQIRADVFQRNAKAERIATALGYLLQHGMAREEALETRGRRAHRYYAFDAVNAKSPPTADRHPYGVNGVIGVPPTGNGNARETFEL